MKILLCLFCFVNVFCFSADEQHVVIIDPAIEYERISKIIETNPKEAFHEMMKILEVREKLFHRISLAYPQESAFAVLNKFNIIKKNFRINDIEKKDELNQILQIATEVGVFDLFHRVNIAPLHTKPILYRTDRIPYNESYAKMYITMFRFESMIQYKTLLLISQHNNTEAVTCIVEFVNAEILVALKNPNMTKFLEFVCENKSLSDEQKKKMVKLLEEYKMQFNGEK